ncbi:fibronectin type III domain-containing protein [Flavobacterium sp. RSB2_4_14]|uniref:fibronectin type III domain-containing protein n=1 Tax=Flavobacterium sp. RSB2_4_14 TaxID=3447665 RepID=UPI003F308CBB
MNKLYIGNILLLLVFFTTISTNGQGTTCATAIPITINGACGSGTIIDTSPDLPALATCATGTFRREGWYKFTVTGGPLNLTITGNASNRNLFLQLISEATACGTLTQIGCANSDTNGNTAQTETITVTNLANGTYYIKVANVGNNNDMTLTSLCVSTTPLNDTCGGASTITSNTSCVNTTGSTLGATFDTGTGVCTTGTENAVWYQFQAVATTHVVTVDGAAGFDPVLNVISNCGSAVIPSGGGCIDATADDGIETRTLTGLTIGAFYKIQVHDYWGDLTANGFTICVTHTPICTTPTAQPTSLVFGATTDTSITGSFTAASPAPNKYLIVRSTSASAPSPGPVDGIIYLVNGSVGGGTIVSNTNATSFTATGLTPGTQYYFYVYSFNDTACSSGPVYLTTSILSGTRTTLCATGTTVASNTITTTSANITWTGTGNYIVEYGLTGFTPGTGATAGVGGTIASSTATSPYALTGLTATTTYQVYVRQVCALGGYSANSTVHAFTTACATPTAQPTSLVFGTTTDTSIAGSFTAASPAPNKYLVVRSTSATAPSPGPVNGTTYLVNGVFSGATVVSNTNATSFTATGLTPGTQYYFYVYSFNDTACSGGPVYLTTSILSGTRTTLCATGTTVASNTITTTSANITWTGTGNYIVEYGLTGFTPGTGATAGVGGTIASSSATSPYALTGLTATTTYQVYVRQVCTLGGYSANSTVHIFTTSCTTPTAQPTSLVFGAITSTTIAGSFTAASPAPNKYLVVRSTSATAPSPGPVNGTTYLVNGVFSGATVVSNTNATSFTASGLSGNTRYYFYVYSFNDTSCSGGPAYNTLTPLTNNSVTCVAVPNTVSTASIGQNDFILNWTTPTGGSEFAITYTVQVTTDPAFTNNVIDSPFTVVDPTTTLYIDTLLSNTTYYYRILANNGCSSAYVNGTITTLPNPCAPPLSQAFNFVSGTITDTSIAASFSGTADGYLVIRSTSATPPSQPINGTTYNAGNIGTLGSGLTFVQSSSLYTFNNTGLLSNTRYYYYIYAFNGSIYCSGGPVYNSAGALTGTAVTCAGIPTGVASASITTNSFVFNWVAPVGGSASSITYTLQVTTNPTYTTNVIGSPFTVTNPTTTQSVTGLSPGTTYYYRILASNGCQSAYVLGTATTSVINDECVNAIPLTVNPSSVCVTSTVGTTIGATQSTPGCSGTADDDVWYSFTATTTSHTITVTPSTLYDAVFQLYIGNCATPANCIDNGSVFLPYDPETVTFTGLNIGTVYYIRVYSYYSTAPDRGDFSICITTPVAPTNDDCAGATPLTVNPTTTCATSTNGNTQYATQSQVGCTGNADDDVWYSFVATGTRHTVTVNPITLNNVVFEVFSGNCLGLTSLQCVNNTNGANFETTTLTGLSIGTIYLVRVYSNGNAGNAGTFSICVTTPCSAGPGTGTSSTSCPNLLVGAASLNGVNPPTIACTAPNNCVNLEAVYPDFNQTTSYSVTSIPYAPPYQFNCLANPISVNIDDVWSNIVTLPFNFCFYGNNYNQVLIGSNGVITFNTSTYTPGGGTGYTIANNLPSPSLALNSIFGVHHDIDPSKGGQVGWELVTLSSGCRALVASWSDIPMFSSVCNNILYSGMMVLHENSNIIDVFVKEKNVCPSWNGGNAIIGIQNSTGTIATVAPNRNSLDTDWTVLQEAWRFTPAGASIASVKWFQGVGIGGTQVGTGNNITVCPSSSTTYTAEITYAFCNGVTTKITGQTNVTISTGKIWTGSVDTNWNVANNWSPSGVPTNMDCITIPNVTNKPIISGTSYNAFCHNLTINNGASLTVQSSNTITVTDFVNVNTGGIFDIKNSASLVQVNNTATNTGNITMDRTTNVKKYDYVYWSSPVRTFNSGSIIPSAPTGYIFKWNTTISNGNGGQGNWVSGLENMAVGKGYIGMVPFSYSASAVAPMTATFNGIANNGIKRVPIFRGSHTGANYAGTNGITITNLDDNWNLLGNPYPSAIDAKDFLLLNTNINGNVRLWTHGSPISSGNANPFYGSFNLNYNVNDYVSFNGVGSTPPGFNGKIGAGQSFFVIMNDGTASSGIVTFNNSLRSNTYNNSQFYRQNNIAETEPEKDRFWISLVRPDNLAATTLIGYVEDATYGEDRLFDAVYKPVSEVGIYSILNDKTTIIQGRQLPFDDNDFIPLGITIPNNGVYTIGISQAEGLFMNDNQNIFLEDTYTNVIHDLRLAPYTFQINTGRYDNRFILRYKNESLGNPSINENETFAYINNHIVKVQSKENIKEIKIFDMTGKLITTYKPDIMQNNFEENFPYANGVYLAIIKLDNDSVVKRKLLN